MSAHREDIEYVQADYPDIAKLLTVFSRIFGRGEFEYRAAFRLSEEIKPRLSRAAQEDPKDRKGRLAKDGHQSACEKMRSLLR